ncbi:MAG: hypothetical protein RLZZ303_1306 [Candidatus Hydrogenedentota bacterium]|jgi:hippurate hydrolase
MLDPLREAVRRVAPEAIALRHELHRHPEIRFEEAWTSARIARWLDESGVEYTRGHAGGTGIVARIPGAGSREILLRADIDALEIQEETGLSYASEIPGRMHACGHDGHTAILCGVTRALKSIQKQLPCSVRCVFQPAEEEAAGGRLVVDEGLLDGVEAAFALHGWPSIPVGRLAVGPGTVMASADAFQFEITGKAGHAADPVRTIDPVVVGAHLVTALQTVVSRCSNPWDAVVLSVTRIESGHTGNIIPGRAIVAGTLRALNTASRKRALEAAERIGAGIAAAWDASIRFSLGEVRYPATINDPDMARYALNLAGAVFGEDKVEIPAHPYMTAEDFGYYLERTPGAFAFLGTGNTTGDGPGLHTPFYDFGDASVEHGMLYLAGLAMNFGATQGDRM